MPTILVIDDTALARESVARLLEYEGFRTVRAANGKEGYATLYAQTPDLILLDLMMPEMDGLTFLRMIRRSSQWENIPVILLTGLQDDDRMISRAREFRVEDVISKAKFGFDDLLARVQKFVAVPAAKTGQPVSA